MSVISIANGELGSSVRGKLNQLFAARNRYVPTCLYSFASNQEALTTVAGSANQLRSIPIQIFEQFTFDQINFIVTTFSAGTNIRIGIYTDNGSLYPDALVAGTDLGNLSTAANGVISTLTASDIVLAPGIYHIVIHFSGAPTLGAVRAYSTPHWYGFNATLSGTQPIGYSGATAYTALPSTYPAGQGLTTSLMPVITLRCK